MYIHPGTNTLIAELALGVPKGEIVEAYWDSPPSGFYCGQRHTLNATVMNTGDMSYEALIMLYDAFAKPDQPLSPISPAEWAAVLAPGETYSIERNATFDPGTTSIHLRLYKRAQKPDEWHTILDEKRWDFDAMHWPFTIYGQVLYEPTGDPLAGIRVVASGPRIGYTSGAVYRSETITDANGQYSIHRDDIIPLRYWPVSLDYIWGVQAMENEWLQRSPYYPVDVDMPNGSAEVIIYMNPK